MIFTGNLQLTDPGWLLLLPPLWALAWIYTRRHRRRSMWISICDPQLLQRMRSTSASAGYSSLPLWPLLLLFSLGVIAAAGPGWRAQAEPMLQEASARIVVLDLSSAMLVEDVKPSRYEQAIAAAREIIAGEHEGETGLVVYAGAAFKVSPLSRDSSTLLAFVDALKPGIMPLEGARLDLAIEHARELLAASAFGRGHIIAITAGGGPLSRARDAAAAARGQGHRVSILAVGTSAGGPLVGADGSLIRDANGNHRLAKVDLEALSLIARAGNGSLLSLQQSSLDGSMLLPRVEAATLLEADSEIDSKLQAIANEGYWLVWIMLPLALLLFRKNLLWLLLFAVCLQQPRVADASEQGGLWQHREQQAFSAYRQEAFGTALELSRAPMLKGAAHYRRGEFQQALLQFERLRTAPAFYNQGNALIQLERYDEALGAFSQALELDPGFAAARFNRRLVSLYLQQAQSESASEADESSGEEDDFGSLEPGDENSRIGVVGQDLVNPADQQELGPGLGASLQSGQVDPSEQYDGSEQAPDRFALRESDNPETARIIFDRWISAMPSASSDLFERKFLRDYQRQKRESR